MSPLVFLLLVASGALTEAQKCADGSDPTVAPRTASETQASLNKPEIDPRLLSTEEFASADTPTKPEKTVCMVRVKCAGDTLTGEELQRDEEVTNVPTTPEGAATTTSTDGTTKAKRPPIPCTINVPDVEIYHGHCVRLDENYGGCRAGPYLVPEEPPCHPLPQD